MHLLQALKALTGDETEIARVERKISIDHAAHQPIEDPGREALKRGVSLAFFSLSINNVIALAIAINHLVDYRQGVLQVSVNQHNRVAACVIEPGRNRNLVAKISRKMNDFNAGISSGPRSNLRK